LELRYQQKKYSGYELKIETIRDRSWLEARKYREEAQDFYFDNNNENILGRDYCGSEDNPNLEAECIRNAREHLNIPGNTWRGAQSWRGLSILAPRLSFVTTGSLYSDHRYVEDLTLYEDFQSALDASSRAHYFSTSKYRVHLDAKNFYTGVGASFGDS